jgi:hypothetical protein
MAIWRRSNAASPRTVPVESAAEIRRYAAFNHDEIDGVDHLAGRL